MSISVSGEKVLGVPVSEDAISYGTISASNISIYLELRGILFSGNLSYRTITVTFKGVSVEQVKDFPPSPSASNFGTENFPYDGKIWHVLSVSPGPKFSIGGTKRYYQYTISGICLQDSLITI